MPVQNVVAVNAMTKHSVRVEWFRREPGGSTIFVKPAGSDEVDDVAVHQAPQEAGEPEAGR